jgi:hypothetical protein
MEECVNSIQVWTESLSVYTICNYRAGKQIKYLKKSNAGFSTQSTYKLLHFIIINVQIFYSELLTTYKFLTKCCFFLFLQNKPQYKKQITSRPKELICNAQVVIVSKRIGKR